MMPKLTSAAKNTPIKVVIVTMDGHIAAVVDRVRVVLQRELPGLDLKVHAASEWAERASALAACKADIITADIIFANMLFLEEHIQAVLPELKARQEQCDAIACCMSAGEVVRLTRLGGFRMDAPAKGGPLAFLKSLRGNTKKSSGAGEQQMKMLRRLPKLLRFIPGTAQDVRAYFLAMQYWLAGSEDNMTNLVRFLVSRYADGPRKELRGTVKAALPIEYPETGLYHPALPLRFTERPQDVPGAGKQGTIGLLIMRSYVLSGDTAHYDAVVSCLEARGFRVLAAFASGLDSRPAVEKFFVDGDRVKVDAVLSLTGFSLVGGPAFNDAKAAEDMLARLDVPYVAAHAIELQTIEQWATSGRGLLPVESTLMVAIPELDGATGPMVFAGRPDTVAGATPGRMTAIPDRVEALVARVERLVRLRKAKKSERNVAIVLFNFPPNGGATGSAASLSVWSSLYNTLRAMAADGYDVKVPASVDDLRCEVTQGNSARYGTDANVHHRISADDHVQREPWLTDIEAQWGPAPGRAQSDGSSIFVLGKQFGRVFVGIQPAFGYEGDPMRLLFESGFAPTHAFSAFYRYLRQDFSAHVVLHFGTHGALEFMPGKQAGLSSACWPDRLIGDLPNVYLYACNNPSEGTIAKRRAAATLVSYLTPPVSEAGLYKGLLELRECISRWRSSPPEHHAEQAALEQSIATMAEALDFAGFDWSAPCAAIAALMQRLDEYEAELIPCGLHVVGEGMKPRDRAEYLRAMASSRGLAAEASVVDGIVSGLSAEQALDSAGASVQESELATWEELVRANRLLSVDHELEAILHAIDGRFIRPAPGGDLLHNAEVLPTGRNVHGFDPFRIPSALAVSEGTRQAERILERHREDGHPLPESVAMVLWGTDNLKSEGAPIAQALALIGARPRFDSYGRITGASLIPLEELGRPRIDVIVTLSGIFRDLLPLQIKLLAEAAYLAASALEPLEMNYVRRNTLAHQAKVGVDFETAALRVFSNDDGAYGSNVNQLVESGAWEDEDELADAFTKRKSFAFGRNGKPSKQPGMLETVMSKVDLAYQNLESVELGVTTIDHYFDTLGGIGRTVKRAKGAGVPIYIGDPTNGGGKVRTIGEQVALESRTRVLNPKWYEEMLRHGAEGVRHIEAHVANTMGWSATTGQVDPWVYKQISMTFVIDPEMRERMAKLNPKASVKLANRLLEANQRKYWEPEPSMLEALRRAGEELEDRLEGVSTAAAA